MNPYLRTRAVLRVHIQKTGRPFIRIRIPDGTTMDSLLHLLAGHTQYRAENIIVLRGHNYITSVNQLINEDCLLIKTMAATGQAQFRQRDRVIVTTDGRGGSIPSMGCAPPKHPHDRRTWALLDWPTDPETPIPAFGLGIAVNEWTRREQAQHASDPAMPTPTTGRWLVPSTQPPARQPTKTWTDTWEDSQME